MSGEKVVYDPDQAPHIQRLSDMSPDEYEVFQKRHKKEIAELPSPFYEEVTSVITLTSVAKKEVVQ